MAILHQINHTPLWRPLGVAQNIGRVCLIVLRESLAKLPEFLSRHNWLSPEAIFVPDLDPADAQKIRIERNGRRVPVVDGNFLGLSPGLEKVFLGPDDPATLAAYLSEICIFLAGNSVSSVWVCAASPPAHSLRQAQPQFFHAHANELEQAQRQFEDEESRRAFAGRVKAILTGNSGYIPIAPYHAYFHPLVHPENGDVMIDGGVSDLVGSQLEFIEAVGPSGVIYGFEPIPAMAQSAGEKLRDWPFYHVQCSGLAATPGEAVFDDLRDSSCLSSGAKAGVQQVRCRLDSIDNFCREQRIKRVNCIKLDVEGAELDALRGARGVIEKYHPRLIVCLYHKPADMYEIPMWIKRVAPAYKLYLGHSSCQFMDTVLYASFPE